MLFLERECLNVQGNIAVLIRRLKFFSAGFSLFQPVTCGREVFFFIFSAELCAYEEKIGLLKKNN